MEEIKISPEVIFDGPIFKITNSLFTSFVVSLVILIFIFFFRKKISLIPKGFYNFFESVIEAFYNFVLENLPEKGKKFFPLIFTIFFYIFLNNLFGILPIISGVKIGQDQHLFRSTFSDINMTIALAICTMIIVHLLSLKELKLTHLKKFLNFSNPINFFIGILEGFSEISKVVSFSFRLFGNIFAGEVVLVIIGTILPLIAPMPFLALEMFIGFIQALIFSFLIMMFLKINLEH